ncbi:hypothetical protein EZS27_036986, partial [termite gut metagenome]
MIFFCTFAPLYKGNIATDSKEVHNKRAMIKKSNILNLFILNLLLLLVGCNSGSDEKEENRTSPISLLFSTDVRSGEENPLLGRVNARLHLFGKENGKVIEEEILIDNHGQGNIEHLTEGKWH